MAGDGIRVLTWNLYHGRDGLPGLGPTCASTLLGTPVDDGVHLHLNRKLTPRMGDRLAAWAPDVAALQEVPAAAIPHLARRTRSRAVWVATGPRIGPRALRDALAARNPDLWRSHEGSANVLLIGPRLRVVPGSVRALRLNPPATVARAALRLGLGAGELWHWGLAQVRAAVMARVSAPGGGEVAVACVHCHNARDPRVTGLEIARAARALEDLAGGGPAVLAGDLNARPSHPALAALAQSGWDGAEPVPGAGIDRILHRGGLEARAPARALPVAEREIGVVWRGRARRVRLSDHDPVAATYGLPGGLRGSGSRAGPAAAP